MIAIDVKAQVEDAVHALHEMGKEIPNVQKRLLSAVGKAARDQVRSRMGAFLQLNRLAGSSGGKVLIGKKGKPFKGTLQRRVYGYSRSPTHWVVAAPRYIAEPLERGAIIMPKNGKTLSFVGAEGFRRAKSVTIPARHWFSRSLAGFEDSAVPSQAIAEAEKKLIAKFDAASGIGGVYQ